MKHLILISCITLFSQTFSKEAWSHSYHIHDQKHQVKKSDQMVKLPYESKKLKYPFLAVSKAKRVDTDIETLKKRVEVDPSATNLNSLASAYIKKARATGNTYYYVKATSAVKRSLKLRNTVSATIAWAEIEQADHHFDKALSIIKHLKDEPEARAIRIKIYLGMKEYDKALQEANELVEALPLMSSYIYLGTVYEAMEKPNKAADQYYAALQSEDVGQELLSAWVRSLLGRLYLKHGELEHAKTSFNSALAIVPTYPMATALVKLTDGES